MDRLARAELIADIARETASSNDLQTILNRVMARLREAISFRGGSIAFPGDDGMLGIAVAVGSIDEAALAVRIPPGQGVVGTVFATGRPFRSGDLDAETRVRPEARSVGTNSPMRSYLCVPLASGGEIFGALEIDSAEADAFDDEDQGLLETIGAKTSYGSRTGRGIGGRGVRTGSTRGAGPSNSGGALWITAIVGRSRARWSAPCRYVGEIPLAQ